MSKKINLEVGKFYMSYGGSAHPALIYEKTCLGTYKSIKFGTTKRKHMTEINPIQKGYEKSFVQNRPFEGTRADFGDKELEGLQIQSEDIPLIEEIKKKESRKTKRASSRYKNK